MFQKPPAYCSYLSSFIQNEPHGKNAYRSLTGTESNPVITLWERDLGDKPAKMLHTHANTKSSPDATLENILPRIPRRILLRSQTSICNSSSLGYSSHIRSYTPPLSVSDAYGCYLRDSGNPAQQRGVATDGGRRHAL